MHMSMCVCVSECVCICEKDGLKRQFSIQCKQSSLMPTNYYLKLLLSKEF
jgi:hypothetical protein